MEVAGAPAVVVAVATQVVVVVEEVKNAINVANPDTSLVTVNSKVAVEDTKALAVVATVVVVEDMVAAMVVAVVERKTNATAVEELATWLASAPKTRSATIVSKPSETGFVLC